MEKKYLTAAKILDLDSLITGEKNANLEIAYNKQRDYCMNLQRRTKKKIKKGFSNISITLKTDRKNFWKTVKPLFSEKISHKEIIDLIDNETILNDDQVIVDTFINKN